MCGFPPWLLLSAACLSVTLCYAAQGSGEQPHTISKELRKLSPQRSSELAASRCYFPSLLIPAKFCYIFGTVGGPHLIDAVRGVTVMSIYVPFLGRLKIKPVYAVRSHERVLFRSERMALTLLKHRASHTVNR